MRSRFNPDRWCDEGNVASRRVNVAMCEKGDRALMVGFIRVMMDQLVQRLAGSQRGHEQNQPNQQDGNQRLAELTEIFLLVLQTISKVVNSVPSASNF